MTCRLCEALLRIVTSNGAGNLFRLRRTGSASKTPYQKTYKKQLTQGRQCGKIIPIADEAAPFERASKKISKKSFDKPLRMW